LRQAAPFGKAVGLCVTSPQPVALSLHWFVGFSSDPSELSLTQKPKKTVQIKFKKKPIFKTSKQPSMK
jgi:hypothetical protein